MVYLFCGALLGFVMSSVLFIQKIWRLQDKLAEARHRAKFYKRECENLTRQQAEWEIASKCDSSNYFSRF